MGRKTKIAIGCGAAYSVATVVLLAVALVARSGSPDEIPVAAVPVAAPASPPPAPPPPPVDPALVERGRERFGSLEGWAASEAPCPVALPLPSTEVPRAAPDITGARRASFPPPLFPVLVAIDEERALAALALEPSEPTLVLWRTERTAPEVQGPHLFRGGRASGRAFLRVPGVEGIACVGAFVAESSSSLEADPSALEIARLEDAWALEIDLELRTRRAAVESLRAPLPR